MPGRIIIRKNCALCTAFSCNNYLIYNSGDIINNSSPNLLILNKRDRNCKTTIITFMAFFLP